MNGWHVGIITYWVEMSYRERVMVERQTAERVDCIHLTDHPEAKKYPKWLHEIAKNLSTQGQHSFAIVLAHTACELAVEQGLTSIFIKKKLTKFRDIIVSKSTSYNIAAERIHKLYIALTDDSRIQCQDYFWPEFKKSVERRNDVVHRGKMFDRENAKKSLDATEALIAYLDQKFSTS